jgi:YVTN family beta-propeller protein
MTKLMPSVKFCLSALLRTNKCEEGMKHSLFAATYTAMAIVLGGAPSTESRAQTAYIPNNSSNTVSVIDTYATPNIVTATILVGNGPLGVAVALDGSKVYIGNQNDNTVSVIETTTNMVIGSPINVGVSPSELAVAPDGSKVYVSNANYNVNPGICAPNTVSVIHTIITPPDATPLNGVTSISGVGSGGRGLAITPDGSTVFVVSGWPCYAVYVIDTASQSVINTIPLTQGDPVLAAISPDGSKVFVSNDNGVVSVIGITHPTPTTTSYTVEPTPIALLSTWGLAVTPDGKWLYAGAGNNVDVINTATNAYTTISGFKDARGLAVTPDGSKVYVTNAGVTPGYVSVIDSNPASPTYLQIIVPQITVGNGPIPRGVFIGQFKKDICVPCVAAIAFFLLSVCKFKGHKNPGGICG